MLFLILIVLLFNFVVIAIPKRMSGIEILTTTLFAETLQVMTDIFLDLKFNLYGYFEEGVDLGGLIYIIGIFPAVNIVYLNFYPYGESLRNQIFYLFCWTIFAILFEVLFLWSGTFYYNGWKLWYSAIIYPGLYLILMFFHKYTRYLLKRLATNRP